MYKTLAENVRLSLLPFVVDMASGFYNGMLGALRLSFLCPALKYDFQHGIVPKRLPASLSPVDFLSDCHDLAQPGEVSRLYAC